MTLHYYITSKGVKRKVVLVEETETHGKLKDQWGNEFVLPLGKLKNYTPKLKI